jgi:hypothetical protein
MIKSTLKTHLKRYPDMQLSDVYKLLHQASFGATHAITKRDSTLQWLLHESRLYQGAGDAPLLESVSDDQMRVRLHLHPYLAAGGDSEALVDALIADGGADVSMADQMADYWNAFAEMRHNFPTREVDLFGMTYARQNWCAVQHSPQFIAAYQPAYRVLKLATAQQLCESQGIKFKVV